jgi:hypothetical protein
MQSKQPNQSSEERQEVNRFDLNEIPAPQLTGHQWRQQGTILLCQSCPFTHASHIPPDYQLYGIGDDGMPMIKKLEF